MCALGEVGQRRGHIGIRTCVRTYVLYVGCGFLEWVGVCWIDWGRLNTSEYVFG